MQHNVPPSVARQGTVRAVWCGSVAQYPGVSATSEGDCSTVESVLDAG